MPLSLRPPPRSGSLTLRSSLRLILPLEGFSSDIANDFPAALDFLDRHSLTLSKSRIETRLALGAYLPGDIWDSPCISFLLREIVEVFSNLYVCV